MKKSLSLLLLSAVVATYVSGCAMFTSWKSIPPPGGCDQCHSLPISTNWKAVYKAPNLNDEKNRPYFQTETYNIPHTDKPASPLEQRKVEEMPCFDCHKTPTPAHKERKGRFHH